MIWNKIKHWFWWKFIASDKDKAFYQAMTLGHGILKQGKFVDVRGICGSSNEYEKTL